MTALRWKTTFCAWLVAALLSFKTVHAADTESTQTVVVTGQRETYRASQPTIGKYTQPLRETPQTITVLPRKLIKDQAAVTTRETLRNVPGLAIAAGEGGNQGDNITIRGFGSRSDFFLDGMRDFGNYTRDPFNTEQIEVLQGPASVMFGRGSTGGVVNQQTKTARLDHFGVGAVVVGTDRTNRGLIDVNERLESVSKSAAVRVNAMAHRNEVIDRDIAASSRDGVALSVVQGLGTPTRFTLNYLHQQQDDEPDYGIPWFRSAIPEVRRANFYGFASDHDHFEAEVDIATLRVEHDLPVRPEGNARLTLRSQTRVADYDRSFQVTEPVIAATVPFGTAPGNITVTRNQIVSDTEDGLFDQQLDVFAHFQTGDFHHNVATGLEFASESSDPIRARFQDVPATNLLAPNPFDRFRGTGVATASTRARVKTRSAYAVDTIGLSKRWDVLAGARYDEADADVQQFVGTRTRLTREDAFTSWRAGLVHKPNRRTSIYYATGTSFNPSAEQLALQVATANVEPEESRTQEIGAKVDLPDPRITLGGAVFKSAKGNAREVDPTNALQQILSGDHEARGFQLSAAGVIGRGWDIFTGYGYLDARVKRSINPLLIGNALPNAPRHTFNLFTTYHLTPRLTIGGGAFANSRRASTTNVDANTGLVRIAPGFVTTNLMMGWQATDRIHVQGTVQNANDKFYIEAIHPNHAIPAAGRTALVITTVKL